MLSDKTRQGPNDGEAYLIATDDGKWTLFKNSEKLFTDEFNHKWLAYLNAADAAGIPPINNPEILKSIKQVFAFSDFVAAGCARDPALPVDLVNSGDLIRGYA